MEKLNALFKSHRQRLPGLSVKTGRSVDAEDVNYKSAPCTPYAQRDLSLDSGCLNADSSGNTPRLAHLDCAGSTPRLSRAQNCRTRDLDVKAFSSRPAFDCDCDEDDLNPSAVFDSCGDTSPALVMSCHPHGVKNDLSGPAEKCHCRRRPHRSRESHRPSHRIAQKNNMPGGLDKSWAVCRLEGLEMLQQSVEQRRERSGHSGHLDQSLTDNQTAITGNFIGGTRRDRSKSRSDSNQCQHRTQLSDPVKIPELKVCIERRLVELTRQLAEERQKSRQDKLNLAKLQQELARQKSEHPLREMLMKELERERRLRAEAEKRLREKLSGICDCKPRLVELQSELAKTKEFAHGLIPYKSKYERLKEDQASIAMNFESRTESYQTEILHLTEENSSLNSELLRMQKICSGCRTCNQLASECRLSLSGSHSDDSVVSPSDKTKILLEKLKMLETEKTCLVLENEKQCEQYEKCLDDITCQVLQALMSQRTLKEECSSLKCQVIELQQQNEKMCRLLDQQTRQSHDASVEQLEDDSSIKWDERQARPWSANSDLVASLGSLNSMCSDHEQLQYLFGRLSSAHAPPSDFAEPCDDALSSPFWSIPSASHSMMAQTEYDGEVQNGKAAENETNMVKSKEQDHTGSTVSLNELLDSCIVDGENAINVNECIGRSWPPVEVDKPPKVASSDSYPPSECDDIGLKARDNLPNLLQDINDCRKHFGRLQTSSDPSSSSSYDKSTLNHKAGLKANALQSNFPHSRGGGGSSTDYLDQSHHADDGYHSNGNSVTSPEGTLQTLADNPPSHSN